MSEPQYVAETLAWCNAQRKERGKKALEKLPKGWRRDGASCPCGKATGLHVTRLAYGTTDFSHDDRCKIGDLPEAVTHFVSAFDFGELPQYEAKP